jgi:tetratricopeptide (TPR) repeat protein
MAAAGFATGAFVAAYPLDSRFGLDRGFETYDDSYAPAVGPKTFLYAERRAAEVVGRASAWWSAQSGRRRFAWVHFFDPHYPYEPREPFASRFAGEPYLGEVAAVDAAIATLVEPLLENAVDRPVVIAVTSDHGEALGDHGEETHGLFAYEATLKVPLLLWGPGIAAGTDARPAGHVDLLPTLLQAAGLPPVEEGSISGRSLLVPGRDGGAGNGQPHYFEALTTNLTNGWAPLRGVVMDGRKFIDLPLPELYDLDQDPAEARNLLLESPKQAAEHRQHLPAESVWPPVAGETTLEEEAQLRKLGYLAGRTEAKETFGPDDDPKNLLDLDRMLQRMVAHYAKGDLEEAAGLARAVLERRPATPVAYTMLAQVLLDQRRLGEAVELMRATRERGWATDALERQLALTLVETGRPVEAISIVEPLLEKSAGGEEPEDLVTYGLALSAAGRHPEGASALDRALALEPNSTRALEAAALVAIRQERYDDAEALARRSLAVNEQLATSWNFLGIALYSAGREGALEAWQWCVELDPLQFDALFNIGMVGSELGEPEVARQALERFIATAPERRYREDLELARQALAALQE